MIRPNPRQLPSPIRRSPPVGGIADGGPAKPSNKFAASTCRKCGAITITGTTYGLLLHLEPDTLNDHTEYQALLNHVPTYNLLPDRTAQRRHLEHIRAPSRHPRHAQHTCGTQYGTDPRPPAPASAVTNPDGPPPF